MGRIDRVNNVALLVKVLSLFRGNSNLSLTAVVSLEKFERVAAGYDAGALVVQQRCRISFKDRGVVAECF